MKLQHFNVNTVSKLQSDTRSEQFNYAIEFSQGWLKGWEHFVFHTSGSTGDPKRIELTRQQLEASAQATIKVLNLQASEHIFVCLNVHLIAGSMMLVRGLLLGCEIYITDPSSNPLKDLPEDHEMTFASFVPMQLQVLLNSDDSAATKLNRFKKILVGGAAVSPALDEKLSRLDCECYETYGMTETVSHVALKRIGKDKYFTALPGVELKADERDCLCIRAEVTKNEWVVTNDVVEFIAPGRFILKGRMDHVINSGGVKVHTQEVEQALFESLAVMDKSFMDAFIASVADETLGQKVIAVLKGPSPGDEFLSELKYQLQKRLSKYEMPKDFFFTDDFEVTASGKINKNTTLAKALNGR